MIADVGTAHDNTAHLPEPTLLDVQEVLDRRFPGGARATDAVWLSSFRINERKVADYRGGRAFLAGDAAHVHSPMGGQGMNTGIQNVCNLAWKLAMVIHEEVSADILDSYSLERSPVAASVLSATGRMTSMATLKGKLIQTLRNHTASLILGIPAARRFASNLASELSVSYAHSPLNSQKKRMSPKPGERAPVSGKQPVGSGILPRFAIYGAQDAPSAALLERFSSILESSIRTPFDPDGLWVVRPDGYVGLTAEAGDWSAADDYLSDVVAKGRAS